MQAQVDPAVMQSFDCDAEIEGSEFLLECGDVTADGFFINSIATCPKGNRGDNFKIITPPLPNGMDAFSVFVGGAGSIFSANGKTYETSGGARKVEYLDFVVDFTENGLKGFTYIKSTGNVGFPIELFEGDIVPLEFPSGPAVVQVKGSFYLRQSFERVFEPESSTLKNEITDFKGKVIDVCALLA